ncbi:zinc ABC transporter substrate-binding protein [bacterium]|nr:zinc ABC transporter substrate-binding protein [bacterium]
MPENRRRFFESDKRSAAMRLGFLFGLVLLVGLLPAIGCSSPSSAPPAEPGAQPPLPPDHKEITPPPGAFKNGGKRPLIVGTTTIIADMLRMIAEPDAQVAAIMGPGRDPHIYNPTPDDGILFRRADLVFVNGLHLEGKMIDMIEAVGNKAVKLGEDPAIKTRQMKGVAAPDPHVWWNAAYFARQTEIARDRLMELMPDKKDAIAKRADDYIAKLMKAHEQAKATIATIPEATRYMITSHDAFYYFGDAYGLTVDAVLGISTDAQAKAGEPLRLAKVVAERDIPAIFHETSVSEAQNDLVDSIQRLAKEKYGHDVKIAGPLYSDSIAALGEPGGTYLEAFEDNVRMISRSLGAIPPGAPKEAEATE